MIRDRSRPAPPIRSVHPEAVRGHFRACMAAAGLDGCAGRRSGGLRDSGLHFFRQLNRGVGFVQESDLAPVVELRKDAPFVVPARQQNREVRPDEAKLFDGLLSAHSGHREIQQHQRRRALARPLQAPLPSTRPRPAGPGTLRSQARSRPSCRIESPSSITTISPSPGRSGAGSASGCSMGCAEVPAARSAWKRVPFPGAPSTRSVPLCAWMIPSTAASPNPRPRNFVVKNGSQTLARVESSIPIPSSSTSMVT